MLGINNKQAVALGYQEWWRLYWKPRPTVECSTRGGEDDDDDDDDDTPPEGGIVLDTKCSLPSCM